MAGTLGITFNHHKIVIVKQPKVNDANAAINACEQKW